MSGPSAEQPVRPDIVGFLRARIAEDEVAAKEATKQDWADGSGVVIHGHALEHIARHDPARVLREVEAKRRIVVWYEAESSISDEPYPARASALLDVIKAHAAIHDQHPDYDPAWRPS